MYLLDKYLVYPNVFIIMNLQEELKRIKILMEKKIPEDYSFLIEGNFDNYLGVKITIYKNGDEVGYVNLVKFNSSWEFDDDIARFYSKKDEYCKSACDDNFFERNNSAYLYDLKVNGKYRGYGFGDILLNKSNEILKNYGIDYVLLITNCDNTVAQNLYKKHGYKIHQTDGYKDFYFLKV